MRGGAKSVICGASLLLTACTTTQTADLKIRAIPDPSAKLRPGLALIGDARAQMALGNIGLALEGFRKALREDPNSAEAYSGLAKCYESMGRYDLARSNYEAALALTPRDPRLLTAVAVALDQQGETQAAAEARQDAAAVQRATEAPLPQQRIATTAPVGLASSITVQLPPARRATAIGSMASAVAVDLAPEQHAAAAEAAANPPVEVALPMPRTDQAIKVAIDSRRAAVAQNSWSPTLLDQLGSRVNLELPPAVAERAQPAPQMPQPRLNDRVPVGLLADRPVHASLASSAGMLRALAASFGLDLQPEISRVSRQAPAQPTQPERSPYLERLSPGEVALVTSGRPAWRAQLVAQTRTSTTVRWVPIMSAEARPNIRILNGAQRQGLAAQTRTVLLDRGWRKIEIGDAGAQRERSVVFYPASRRTLGRSLAAQFGFPAQLRDDANVLIVLLGRDAARPVSSSRRG